VLLKPRGLDGTKQNGQKESQEEEKESNEEKESCEEVEEKDFQEKEKEITLHKNPRRESGFFVSAE